MKELFDQIANIDTRDKSDLNEATLKMVEEVDECVEEVDELNDRKITTDNRIIVIENIKSEIADSIQNIFCVANKLDEIVAEIRNKNIVWENIIPMSDFIIKKTNN